MVQCLDNGIARNHFDVLSEYLGATENTGATGSAVSDTKLTASGDVRPITGLAAMAMPVKGRHADPLSPLAGRGSG